MTKDNCGWPTDQDGSACQNPATDENGRCWIPSHGDPDADGLGGRPTKFNDQRARDAIEAARQSKSREGCARAAGVSRPTLGNWIDRNPTFEDSDGERQEFFTAFMRARRDGETALVQGGLLRDEVDTSMAKFLLSTSFGYVKTERQEHLVDDDANLDAGDAYIRALEKLNADDEQ